MKVDITSNELLDRLRVVQSYLVEQNEHSGALFVGFAIQFIESDKRARGPTLLEYIASKSPPGGITMVAK